MIKIMKLIVFCSVSFAIVVPSSLEAKCLVPRSEKSTAHELKIYNQATSDRVALSAAVNNVSSQYPVSKSSLDWLFLELIDLQNGFSNTAITVTSESQGTLVAVSWKPGEIPLNGGNYFVGREGTYKYEFSLSLDIAGKIVDAFFSPRRAQLLRVVQENEAGIEMPINRNSIKAGDMIEIVETATLTADATNDNHMQSVTIKVLR